MTRAERTRSKFEVEAARTKDGLLRELWHFLKQTRKWWLIPILVALLLLGILLLVGSTGAAPFVYALF